MRCKNCRDTCSIREKASLSDGLIWQCNKCKTSTSIREGSIFHNSRLPIGSIFKIIYYWAVGIQGHTVAELIPSVSQNAV